jgi:hypothetical protein
MSQFGGDHFIYPLDAPMTFASEAYELSSMFVQHHNRLVAGAHSLLTAMQS